MTGLGDSEPAPGSLEVGGDEHPSVTAEGERCLGIDVHLHVLKSRTIGGCSRQVGDPQVVARLRALCGGHLEPAAITRHLDAVVVRHRHASAENVRVADGVGPHRVQKHSTVKSTLGLRQYFGRKAANVVEALASGNPRNRGVAATIDRPVDHLAGGNVHHVEDRFFGPPFGYLVGEPFALLRRLPRIQSGAAGGVEFHGIDQDSLEAIGLANKQNTELLTRLPLREEDTCSPVNGQ